MANIMYVDNIRVEYDNGVCIFLNYTDASLTAEGVSVQPGGFTVIQGGAR